MLLCNIKNNLKTTKITIIKIVISFVLFVVLSDKSFFNNFFNNIFNGTLSIERFSQDIFSIGRIINTSSLISVGAGVLFAQIAFCVGLTLFAFYYVINYSTVRHDRRMFDFDDHAVSTTYSSTNNLYLQISKFIC